MRAAQNTHYTGLELNVLQLEVWAKAAAAAATLNSLDPA